MTLVAERDIKVFDPTEINKMQQQWMDAVVKEKGQTNSDKKFKKANILFLISK